jgi:hypothetical protein
MKMKRISGYLLLILGFLHVALGVVSGWPQVKAIFAYGVWNALGQQPQAACINNLVCMQLNAIWWFISLGLMIILFGALCIWIERTLKRAIPAFIGWLLLVISAMGAVVIPISGFWLVLAIAIYMLFSARKEE